MLKAVDEREVLEGLDYLGNERWNTYTHALLLVMLTASNFEG